MKNILLQPILVVFAVAAVVLAFLLTLNYKEKQNKMSASPVVVSASGKHTATLIFLHGLGDTGHGWASSLADVRPSYMKIVCPTAKIMPVTLNSGKLTPICFVLKATDIHDICHARLMINFKPPFHTSHFRLSNASLV